MICFICGKHRHKEDACPLIQQDNPLVGGDANEKELYVTFVIEPSARRSEKEELYGSSMLVKKPFRRKTK